MGKKKTAAEKVKAARENGFDDDMTGIDDRHVLREILPYTDGAYETQMELWREYEKDHPGATPCDLRTLKHFVELLANSADGLLEEKATVDTVRGYARRFTSGYERDTGICIPEQVRKSVTNHIKTTLKIKLGLSTAHRPKHYLTLKKYKIIASVVWDKDWYEFDHEAARVAYSAKLNMFCFSSARVGEVAESSAKRGTGKGLHYRDMVMVIGRDLDGRPEIQIQWKREAAKGMHNSLKRPEHPMFETTTGLPLIFNPIIFILAMALAGSAFRDYQTDDEIFDLEPPVYDDHLILDWDDEMKDVPVFQATSCNGPTGKIQKASTCARQLSGAAQRAGFLNCTVHAIRREALVKANANGYTDAELMKFSGQSGPKVFQTFYMAEGSVDGQNSFLNQPLRKDHLESFRGMSMQCNPELWQSLPAQMQYELERRPDFVALEEQIDDLTEEIKTAGKEASRELQARRHKLHKERQRLTLEELKKRRQSQTRNHQSRGTHEPSQGDRHRSFFDRVRHMMPERDRLARTLFQPVSLRSPEGRSALRDLIALYKDDCRVAYQPVLRPISGCCPVSSCARPIQSIPVADQWNHVYRCYEADLKRRYGFAMFCFKCSEWITSEADWELHCQGHIDRFDIPLRCDPITFRYALACAGHCPRCLHKSQRPAAQRMYQFTNRARWLQHVQKCMQEDIQSIDRTKAIRCPYGSPCSVVLESDQHVWPHLQDYHSIDMPNAGRKRRLDSESQSDTSGVKLDVDKPKPKRPRLQGKRRTPTLSPKPDQDGCHGIKSEPPNDTLHYDFVNYSVTDLEPSSADLTTPATTPCSSSGDDFPPNATGTASVQDATTAASLREPSHSPAYVDTLHQIDPRLLPQPAVPPVQDGAICSSSSRISSSAPRRPSSPTGSCDAHSGTSTYGMTEAEVEDRGSLDDEHAYPLGGGHSLRDVVATQEAPRPTINASGDEGDLPALGETLPIVERKGDLADAILICEAVQQGHRDVPSGNLSIGGLPRCDGSRGIWTAPTRDASSSDLLSTITSTTRNDITDNTREPIAEPRAPECLPSRKQSVQELNLPVVTLDDGQCIVERLLGRQVVSRGKGRRKRMVAQYRVKWQGWSDEYNEWVDEDDIHEDLVAAYNSATA